MPNDPFVDVAALPSLGPIRYLDARDQTMFDARHAPGAVRVPVDEWDAGAKAADVGFNNTTYWDQALGSLGIDPSALAVTYDGGQMTNAARVWFVLQYFGIKAVIVNGGWPALSQAAVLPTGAGPSKGVFRAVPGSGAVGLVDRETLKRQLDGAAHVFDTRTRAEFTGEDARNRARSGHLPGAGICRMRICWTMALFVRHRRCEACWSAPDLARAITSSPIAKAEGERHWAQPRRCAPAMTTSGSTISASRIGCGTRVARSYATSRP